jgi:hypothetical protein
MPIKTFTVWEGLLGEGFGSSKCVKKPHTYDCYVGAGSGIMPLDGESVGRTVLLHGAYPRNGREILCLVLK